MSDNIIDKMLENRRKYESGDYKKRSHKSKVQPPDSIDWLDQSSCPDVAVINISQDHWISCKNGPIAQSDRDDKYHTWTAVQGRFPKHLNRGSVLIVRRTNRNSDGTNGSEESGVMGIWIFNRKERVDSNENHPFEQWYSWYIHCTSIETSKIVVYQENWQRLGIIPQAMTGSAVFRLNQTQQIRYLRDLVSEGRFSDDTEDLIRSLIRCKENN